MLRYKSVKANHHKNQSRQNIPELIFSIIGKKLKFTKSNNTKMNEYPGSVSTE